MTLNETMKSIAYFFKLLNYLQTHFPDQYNEAVKRVQED